MTSGQLSFHRGQTLWRGPDGSKYYAYTGNWGSLPAHQPDISLRLHSMMFFLIVSRCILKNEFWVQAQNKLRIVNQVSEAVLMLNLVSSFDRVINYPCLPRTELSCFLGFQTFIAKI